LITGMSMSRRYQYRPLTASEFSRGLQAAHLSMRQFCRISGSDERRVERWLTGEQENPPYWVASLLTAMTVPEARDKVKALADERVINVDRLPPDEDPV